MSFVCTYTHPKYSGSGSDVQFLYSKHVPNGAGHYALIYNNDRVQFGISTDASNLRAWEVSGVKPGPRHGVIAWDGVLAHSPTFIVDGVSLSPSVANNLGTPSNLGNAHPFSLGGRSDGLYLRGFMQEAAFWSNRALTAPEAAELWSRHQAADRGAAIPFILDTDGGSSDKGDIGTIAHCIYLHKAGLINLLGIMVTCGDDYTAPASRAILDYYSLSDIPVGAYKNSNIHAGGGGGTPSRVIRDAFRASDTRASATYADPVSFYGSLLAAADDASVVVSWSGFPNSISAFLNASAGNRALWNSKIRLVNGVAGQFPNSSSSASPSGNFSGSGYGEWNIGGSAAFGAGQAEGEAEAQAAADIIALSTVPHYWHGIEICGNTGNSPLLPELISQDIPSTWSTSNPIRLGWGTGSRTAWDVMGDGAAFYWAWDGMTGAGYWDRVQISTPVIDVSGTNAGHNSSTPGSSNNYYLTPKIRELRANGSSNLFADPSALGAGTWTRTRVTVTDDAVAAPDSTLTAEKLAVSASNSFGSFIYQVLTISSADPHIIFADIKLGDNPWMCLFASDGAANGVRVWFDVSNQQIGSNDPFGTGWSASLAHVEEIGNGWLRLSMCVQTTGTTMYAGLHPATDADASTAGTASTFNYAANLQAVSATRWRNMMSAVWNVLIPPEA